MALNIDDVRPLNSPPTPGTTWLLVYPGLKVLPARWTGILWISFETGVATPDGAIGWTDLHPSVVGPSASPA
jgi:hypothetical protein